MILAAIDIGSNAARLLITEVIPKGTDSPIFNKLNLIRVPVRLGFDVFENKQISHERFEMLMQTMKSFRHLMRAYRVDAFRACATSAMRDAKNSKETINSIFRETGIQIEVISGDEEANLVYENHIAEKLDKNKSYLYIDVGGGSTELSFFSNGVLVHNYSYNIGTIRLLKNKVKDKDWELLKTDIKNLTKTEEEVIAIGSGGNINKLFSLSKKKEGRPLTLMMLKEYLKDMEAMTINERISAYQLRRDRADVIVPALTIYINAMRWANANEIFVPKIGVSDGLILQLWKELSASKS